MTDTTKEIQARHNSDEEWYIHMETEPEFKDGYPRPEGHLTRGILLDRLAEAHERNNQRERYWQSQCELREGALKKAEAAIKSIGELPQHTLSVTYAPGVSEFDVKSVGDGIDGDWVEVSAIKALLKENIHEQD